MIGPFLVKITGDEVLFAVIQNGCCWQGRSPDQMIIHKMLNSPRSLCALWCQKRVLSAHALCSGRVLCAQAEAEKEYHWVI